MAKEHNGPVKIKEYVPPEYHNCYQGLVAGSDENEADD